MLVILTLRTYLCINSFLWWFVSAKIPIEVIWTAVLLSIYHRLGI